MPAVYDEEQQRARLVDILQRWRASFVEPSSEEDGHSLRRIAGLVFAEALSLLVVSFKNRTFEEEREWRLVYRRLKVIPDDGTGLQIHFRARGDMLLPYVPIPTSGDAFIRLPLHEIVMGPNRYRNLAGYAVEQLLQSLGYGTEIPVRASSVPLRT